jgi:hypothetical protein
MTKMSLFDIFNLMVYFFKPHWCHLMSHFCPSFSYRANLGPPPKDSFIDLPLFSHWPILWIQKGLVFA